MKRFEGDIKPRNEMETYCNLTDETVCFYNGKLFHAQDKSKHA